MGGWCECVFVIVREMMRVGGCGKDSAYLKYIFLDWLLVSLLLLSAAAAAGVMELDSVF